METKLFEVRDRATFMVCIGIKLQTATGSDRECRLLWSKGYGPVSECILFGDALGGTFTYDIHNRPEGSRTLRLAQSYVERNWDALESGAIIDVEFIQGETTKPKETDVRSSAEQGGFWP